MKKSVSVAIVGAIICMAANIFPLYAKSDGSEIELHESYIGSPVKANSYYADSDALYAGPSTACTKTGRMNDSETWMITDFAETGSPFSITNKYPDDSYYSQPDISTWYKVVSTKGASGWIQRQYTNRANDYGEHTPLLSKLYQLPTYSNCFFTPDTAYLICDAVDYANGKESVQIFNIAEGTPEVTIDTSERYVHLASCSADSKYLYYADGDRIMAYGIGTKETTTLYTNDEAGWHIDQIIPDNTSDYIAVYYYDANDIFKMILCSVQSHEAVKLTSFNFKYPCDIHFSTDNKLLYVKNGFGSSTLFETATGKKSSIKGVKLAGESGTLTCECNKNVISLYDRKTDAFYQSIAFTSNETDNLTIDKAIISKNGAYCVVYFTSNQTIYGVTLYSLPTLPQPSPSCAKDKLSAPDAKITSFLTANYFSCTVKDVQTYYRYILHFDSNMTYHLSFTSYTIDESDYSEISKCPIELLGVYQRVGSSITLLFPYTTTYGTYSAIYDTCIDMNRFFPFSLTAQPDYEDLLYSGRLYHSASKSSYFTFSYSPSGKEYVYDGITVIKCPDGNKQEPIYITPTSNLKMRSKPSTSAPVVELPYTIGEKRIAKRNVIFEGEQIRAIAVTKETSTIDGITAPWYLIYEDTHDEEAPYTHFPGAYVWIFGGYVKEISSAEYKNR